MAKKIILFNGPPRSGKDTASQIALDLLGERGRFYRFASPLKNAIHSLFGLHGVDEEWFTDVKNVAVPDLYDWTPRELYIWLSEDVVKPKFGKDFFGQAAVNYIRSLPDGVTVVVSDCGFQNEVDVLINDFGADSVIVVQMSRDGTCFDDDSRGDVTAPLYTYSLANNGSKQLLVSAIFDILKGQAIL